MAENDRFRINRPDVIHEILDGELVIVNLRSGSYYSLDPVGAVVWQAVEHGARSAEIIGEMVARFDGDAALVEAESRALLEELLRERLIVPSDGSPGITARAATNGRRTFTPPRLQKYTDMEDLLLLDPIHEVDESGWPTRGT